MEHSKDKKTNDDKSDEECKAPTEDEPRKYYGNNPIWRPETHYLTSMTHWQPGKPIIPYEGALPSLCQQCGCKSTGSNPPRRPTLTLTSPLNVTKQNDIQSTVSDSPYEARPGTSSGYSSSSLLEYVNHTKVPPRPAYENRPPIGRQCPTPSLLLKNASKIRDPVVARDPPPVIANKRGTMTIKLLSEKQVDISIDYSLRVIDPKNDIVLALSACGSSAALLHPMGRIYCNDGHINVIAYDSDGCHKYAKMSERAISFSNDLSPLTYQIDVAGTRTKYETFLDLSKDLSIPVFYKGSRHGPTYQDEAVSVLENALYKEEDNIKTWVLNEVTVKQLADGSLRVNRNDEEYCLHIGPKGSASITTPDMHSTASVQHLFVRAGDKRIHYNTTNLIVRFAGHSAGLGKKGQLKIITN